MTQVQSNSVSSFLKFSTSKRSALIVLGGSLVSAIVATGVYTVWRRSKRQVPWSDIPNFDHTDGRSHRKIQAENAKDPIALYKTGMERLHDAVDIWEEALTTMQTTGKPSSLPTVQQADLVHHLQCLIAAAEKMNERTPKAVQPSRVVGFFGRNKTNRSLPATPQRGVDEALQESPDHMSTKSSMRRSTSGMSVYSDADEFYSADEDLLDEHEIIVSFYEEGLKQYHEGNVPCRTLRTDMLLLDSDEEYLGKIYCLRLGFDKLMQSEVNREWFISTGKEVLGKLIMKGDKDPEGFYIAFDKMIDFVKQEENWPVIEEELKGRKVVRMGFFDIVIDFVTLDSFEDLEDPPVAVTTVTQNRWLSDNFKERALGTAIWSVLKAKRKRLKYGEGFIAHFYDISEHVSPTLAWGFLGTNAKLKQTCLDFKECWMDFVRSLFNIRRVSYVNVDALSEDILKLSYKWAGIVQQIVDTQTPL